MWRYLLLLIAGMLILSGCTNNLAKKDRAGTSGSPDSIVYGDDWDFGTPPPTGKAPHTLSPPSSDIQICLLYTSDAADEYNPV